MKKGILYLIAMSLAGTLGYILATVYFITSCEVNGGITYGDFIIECSSKNIWRKEVYNANS